MTKITQLSFIGISFIAGILYFAYQKEWFIVRLPSHHSQRKTHDNTIEKKTVILYYWHKEQWNQETCQILWPSKQEEQCTFLINKWLSILEEESIIEKKITVQSVIIPDSQSEAFISFDRNLLKKEVSTYENLMIIESLLKTIRENNIKIQKIYFLLHHRPLTDYQLDFSNPWPINGFIDIK